MDLVAHHRGQRLALMMMTTMTKMQKERRRERVGLQVEKGGPSYHLSYNFGADFGIVGFQSRIQTDRGEHVQVVTW